MKEVRLMATKYQLITSVYNATTERITGTPAEWMAFLRSACRNYKCRFDEQVLIYAQRPHAIAVLEIERWNRLFGRWVNRGASGIAVFDDEHNGGSRLKHYFDIADTHESQYARNPLVWEMEPRFEAEVIESLEGSFGALDDNSTLAAALMSAARNAVEDNMGDYLRDLMDIREGSLLEELDALNVAVEYRAAIQNSVAYMLFSRCGVDTGDYFDALDFRDITEFNTQQTVNALGLATSDIAEMCLREISATIWSIQKRERKGNRTFDTLDDAVHNDIRNTNDEGSVTHDRGIDLSGGGRLQPAEPDLAGGRAGSPWQIRIAQKELSEAPPARPLSELPDLGEAEHASDGSRADGHEPDGKDDRSDGGRPGRDRADEGREPDAVGGPDEQYQALGRGDNPGRPDIRIKPLPTIAQQINIFGEAEDEKSSAFAISQQIIDEVLTSGGNEENSIYHIISFFKKDHALADNADFLENEYGEGGKGFIFGGERVSAWFDEDGIHIAHGDTALNAGDTTVITWEQAARRIRELLDMGRYAPQSELDKADEGILFFTADDTVSTARPGFITQDEVDKLLAGGSGVADCKFRIYSFFLQTHTSKEKVDFLKKEYGHGGNSRTGFSEMHDSKGISYSRENNHMPYDKIMLPWSKVAKRIDELIAENRYMSQRELDSIPVYEKGELARAIYFFYYNQPQDVPRPYPYSNYISDAVDIIRPQLDQPERVAEILNQMQTILDNTADFDRRYDHMRKAFDDLTAYQNGTFSLFTPNKPTMESAVQPIVLAPESPAMNAAEYDLHLGMTVYLGNAEYELNSFDDVLVVLRDVNAPLFTLDMPREEFDRSLRENRLNDGLIIGTSNSTEADPVLEPVQPYTPRLGDRYEIQGRLFEVDSIDMNGNTVSLRDITFEGNIGFPIFRSETLDFVRMYDPIRPEPMQPHEEISGLKSIVIDLRPRPDEPAETETLSPAWEKGKPRSRTQTFDLHPEIPMSERYNYRITDDNLGAGGQKAKYRYNVDAIRTLQAIEAENRFATPEEQEVLSRYVGWGGIAQAFDANNPQWKNECAELSTLLTPEEYASARASTLNAHYTSPTVIKAIYKAVGNMGFSTGNILEPSCGIGNFFGLLPDSMSGSKLFGVELDGLTGRIAQQLYQKTSIAIRGFEDTDLPDSFFDLVIGNVPFGAYSVRDKRYDKHKFHIHDYFMAKALDKVRPGGVVAFVTSKFTLDKKDSAVRKYIAQRADFLGAIRLPNTAFKANAGTEVTADIVFLQKRDRIIDIEPDWLHLGLTDTGIPVNSYFAEHPGMILGTMSNDSGLRMYGNENSSTCVPFPDADLSEQLNDAITNIHGEISDYELDENEQEDDHSIPADPNVRNFSYAIVDGAIYYRQDSRMVPVEMSVTAQNRVRGLIELRDCVRTLIAYQTEDYSDVDIHSEQTKLNRLYDSFSKKYGLINSRGNSMAFSQDSAYCLLCSLEILDENGALERKADIFSKRTIRPHTPVDRVDTASEALAVSLSEKACVDLAYMSQLSGMTEDALIAELEGVIYLNIGGGASQDKMYVTADEYLSGNVRNKLMLARAAAATLNNSFLDNQVRALEAVLPIDLTAAEISVRLGATWVPEDVVQQFVFELLQPSGYVKDRIHVQYFDAMGEWVIAGKNVDRSNIHTFNTYGTQRINAYKIIEDSLNLRDVRIFDKVIDMSGNEKRVLNKRETAIAQAKQEIIRSRFQEWIWQDPDRRERLCRIYNDRFNSLRPREYDGSHIRFVGMNPEITLHKHQINAIARILYGGNTLLAHEVGAGKTYEMVAAAMESKRLGLCSKSLIVVPNHITEQWAAEFLQLYPTANILVATKKDFETKNRKKFCARISTGDYDAVIIGHSQFEKIPMSLERQKRMLERQIDELIDAIEMIKHNRGERLTIKQMEKVRKSLEARLKKLTDQSRKDDVVTFEELGVDRLFIDEAHYYKNLYLVTKMRNVGGIAQVEAQKSADLFMKTQYLDEITDGRGTVFATGTPISNSMVEMYTMQRYLQYKTLTQHGLQHFDAWASTFGETVTAIELAPEGTGYRSKTRFAKFYNLPELMSMFKTVADIQTADMLALPAPKANFHTEIVSPSDWQQKMIAELAERAEKIRRGDVDSRVDNMLKVTNDGRKLALDQRLANPLLPDDPEGKVAACANNVFQIWEGIGYEFSGDGLYGVDLDHVLDDLGRLMPQAQEIVNKLASYTELSPSGSGLHIFVFAGGADIKHHRKKNGFVEMYSEGRYFTVTGEAFGGPRPIEHRTQELQEVHDTHLAPDDTRRIVRNSLPVLNDDAGRFLRIGLERDKVFAALWAGERRHGNESADDQALMHKLAYWCNADPSSMIYAFLSSPHHAQKDNAHKKKCQRADYLSNTATRASATVYSTAQADHERWLQQKKTRRKGGR